MATLIHITFMARSAAPFYGLFIGHLFKLLRVRLRSVFLFEEASLATLVQAALSLLNLRLCSRPDEPHFALMALSIASRLRRSH